MEICYLNAINKRKRCNRDLRRRKQKSHGNDALFKDKSYYIHTHHCHNIQWILSEQNLDAFSRTFCSSVIFCSVFSVRHFQVGNSNAQSIDTEAVSCTVLLYSFHPNAESISILKKALSLFACERSFEWNSSKFHAFQRSNSSDQVIIFINGWLIEWMVHIIDARRQSIAFRPLVVFS